MVDTPQPFVRQTIMIIEPMFPIISITGNFSTTRFKTTRSGVLATPRHRRNPTKHTLTVRPETLACLSHKYADQLYQNFSYNSKRRWRSAVKAPVKSPYDLWMQECLSNFNQRRNAPFTPSISGGFTNHKTLDDSNLPAPFSEANRKILDNVIKSGKDPF